MSDLYFHNVEIYRTEKHPCCCRSVKLDNDKDLNTLKTMMKKVDVPVYSQTVYPMTYYRFKNYMDSNNYKAFVNFPDENRCHFLDERGIKNMSYEDIHKSLSLDNVITKKYLMVDKLAEIKCLTILEEFKLKNEFERIYITEQSAVNDVLNYIRCQLGVRIMIPVASADGEYIIKISAF